MRGIVPFFHDLLILAMVAGVFSLAARAQEAKTDLKPTAVEQPVPSPVSSPSNGAADRPAAPQTSVSAGFDEGASTSQEYDLPRSIQTALESNYDILKAKERIQRQRGAVVEVRSRYIPHAAINTGIQQIDRNLVYNPVALLEGDQNNWNVTLEITQSLYTGGRNDALLKNQKALMEAALFELQSVVNNVLLSVRERYYAILLARAEVVVQEQYIQLLEEELHSERNKHEAGTVSSFNVLRAEVALANGRTPLIRARNNLRLALDELTQVLGLAPKRETDALTPIRVVKEQMAYRPYYLELATALQVAQDQRPEFKRLNKMMESQAQMVRYQKAGHQPQLDAFFDYGVQQASYSSHLDEEVHGWTVGLRGVWNIFDGLATEGRIKQAKSDMMLALLELEQTRLNVDVEVRRAFSTYVEASELLAASKKVVQQAQESLRLARARFDVGAATQLDVLDSQVALTQARTNEVRALYDYNVACFRLNKAMGNMEKYEVKAN
ncbi:MAG: TolC family protein [Verrucomicrobiae bacterium]|nr:TolC family protein [Verrucomicrobiae bacterium]